MTDANLCMGRLLPSHFPHIFGPNENQSLSHSASLQAFRALTAELRTSGEAWPDLSVEEVAMGFIQVANEAMCRPIRALTQVLTARRPCPCSGRLRKAPAGLQVVPHGGGRRGGLTVAVIQVGRGSPFEQRPSTLEAADGWKSAGN